MGSSQFLQHGRGEQRQHDLVVTGQGIALAAFLRGAPHHVGLRPVMGEKVHFTVVMSAIVWPRFLPTTVFLKRPLENHGRTDVQVDAPSIPATTAVRLLKSRREVARWLRRPPKGAYG